MLVGKLKVVAAALIAVIVFGSGAGLVSYRVLAAEPAATPASGSVGPKAPRKGEGRSHLVTIPARREGVLLFLGTELKDGEKETPGRVGTAKVDGQVRKYRRLKEGDTVEEGQLLARLEDSVARDEVEIKRQKIIASDADLTAAQKTRDEAEQRHRTAERLYAARGNRVEGPENVRAAKLTLEKFTQETVSKGAAVEVSKRELKQAQTILGMYEVRSPARGVITAVHKHTGEAVKSLEPVLQIRVTEE